MGISARLFGIFAATILLLFSLTNSTFAQIQRFSQSVNPDVENNLHNYSQGVMTEAMSAVICQLAGVDVINPNQACLGVDRNTGKIGFVKSGGGAVGVVATLIGGTFAIPVHFSDYISYEAEKFGFPQKTYAQGIGFVGLRPVLGLFTTFRNMSYLLFVLIFVVVGIAIMLRLRIDPRTVMTIQNQIPKLIIGLVMITFSYAIAGLLIDLMWVSTYFVINTITPVSRQKVVTTSLTQAPPGFVNNIYAENTGIFGLATGASLGVGGVVRQAIHPDTLIGSDSNSECQDFFCDVINFLSNSLASLLSIAFSWIIGAIVGMIAFLIFVIAILVQLFKLWFSLLKSFIFILIDVILAPFWILGGLLPGVGQSVGIGAWLRDLIANLAVFPTVVFLFLISKVIVEGFANATVATTAFNPPLIGNALGSNNAANFGALIAVGFILSAPSIVEQVRKAFKAGGLGGGIGGIGTGVAAMAALGGSVGSQLYWRRYNPQANEYQMGGVIGSRLSRIFRRRGTKTPSQGPNIPKSEPPVYV